MIDSVIVAGYLALVATLGLTAARQRRPGMTDYALAGRALTLPGLVSTLVPTFYGGVLGIGEFTWRNGLSNWLVMAAPYYVFAAVYALLLAGRIRLEPGLTIPDHLQKVYGREVALLAAGLVFILACPADELLMTGTLLSHLSGLTLPTAMGAAALVGLGLLARGGLRADVLANRLELVVMFAGFAVVLPFAAKAADWSALPAGHLTLTGGLTPWQIVAWWLIGLWTIVDPAFHQRCAAARDPKTARNGVLVSILFWMAFDAMTTTAGLYSRAAVPELPDPLLAFPALADRVLPPVARGVFFAGMLSSMLAALQGTSLVAAVTVSRAFASEPRQEAVSRQALAAAGLAAFVLAWALPSVVGLWYAVGSAVIPGLLLPLLGVYFPALRTAPRTALAASALGTAVSLLWLIKPPAPLEPLFPGLAAAALVWVAGPKKA